MARRGHPFFFVFTSGCCVLACAEGDVVGGVIFGLFAGWLLLR